MERFERMLEASTALALETNAERIFERVVEACGELLQAERAFCVLVDGDGTRIAAAWREDGRVPGTPSRSVVRAVLGHGREIAVGDVEERAELRARDSIVDTHVRSVMCVPMFDQTADGARIIGVLYVDRPARSDRQVDQSLRILRALAAQTIVALAGARTVQEVEARARRAADMAHDLRSPASALQMAGDELARSAEVPEWARDAGHLIATQAQRMLDLGNRFLADRNSEPTVFSLGGVAQEVGRVLAPLARASGRSVLVDVVQSVSVEAAEDDIQRVLLNLVQNGLRYTPPGSAVTLQVGRTPEGQAVCRVMDAGEGIAPDLLPHIFDRGVRANSAGHGLGLSIALRLSEAWGGRLTVRNLERQGACFTLSLPETDGMAALA
jgi:signal transduction histidine kinase